MVNNSNKLVEQHKMYAKVYSHGFPPISCDDHNLAPLRRGFFLRRRPESLQGYVAQVVLRRLSDAEMGIDLRDRSLSDSHRRPAFPVVVLWARKLIRPLGNRTGARRV